MLLILHCVCVVGFSFYDYISGNVVVLQDGRAETRTQCCPVTAACLVVSSGVNTASLCVLELSRCFGPGLSVFICRGSAAEQPMQPFNADSQCHLSPAAEIIQARKPPMGLGHKLFTCFPNALYRRWKVLHHFLLCAANRGEIQVEICRTTAPQVVQARVVCPCEVPWMSSCSNVWASEWPVGVGTPVVLD